jgi:hypothetical protein
VKGGVVENDNKTGGAHADRRFRWGWIAAVVVVIAAAGVGYYLYDSQQSDDVEADQGSSGAVSLPQNPSLRLVADGGTWYVENDGNVTMHDVEVRDTAGAVICALGTMSPDDREPCEDADDRTDLVVAGMGPLDQEVENPAPSGS